MKDYSLQKIESELGEWYLDIRRKVQEKKEGSVEAILCI
jgi:hypothetical protein